MFGGFDDLDFNDMPPTWPPAGSAVLVVEDKYEPLFISATWSIVAKVGQVVLARSKPADKAHSPAFVKRWTRQLIRTKYAALRRLGVDADGEYVNLGGDVRDLDDVKP